MNWWTKATETAAGVVGIRHHDRGTHLSLANKITIARILTVPVFVLVTIYYLLSLRRGEPQEIYKALALTIFTLGALTDALDGYVARSRGEVTRLGRILDPIADKALMISALILLTRPSLPQLQPHIPVWFTFLVISRDVVLIVGAIVIHMVVGHVDVRPRMTGKIATVFTMVAVIWALIGGGEFTFIFVVLTAGLFTFASGAQYVFEGIRQLENAPHLHPPRREPTGQP
jgi:CDP-diacylglycerol--glycerol-3-phosphate 3-phosphatidyltransferase